MEEDVIVRVRPVQQHPVNQDKGQILGLDSETVQIG